MQTQQSPVAEAVITLCKTFVTVIYHIEKEVIEK